MPSARNAVWVANDAWSGPEPLTPGRANQVPRHMKVAELRSAGWQRAGRNLWVEPLDDRTCPVNGTYSVGAAYLTMLGLGR